MTIAKGKRRKKSEKDDAEKRLNRSWATSRMGIVLRIDSLTIRKQTRAYSNLGQTSSNKAHGQEHDGARWPQQLQPNYTRFLAERK